MLPPSDMMEVISSLQLVIMLLLCHISDQKNDSLVLLEDFSQPSMKPLKNFITLAFSGEF